MKIKQTRFYVSLHIIVPFIFGGLAFISAIMAFQITKYYVKTGTDSSLAILSWSITVAALAFLIGFIVSRMLLGPVKKFINEGKEHPAISSLEIVGRKERQVDELQHFAQVFDQVTEVLGKVDVQHLFPNIIGYSSTMRRVLGKIMMVAPTNSPVLILGEPGTGKKLIATNICDHSRRKHRKFVEVLCSDIPEKLFERELFGYEEDNLNDESLRKIGQFEIANGGTIYLDEIGNIPLSTQAMILRMLKEGQFERTGRSRPIRIDVRFIAATSKNLAKLVSEGQFNEDLYYYLNVFSLEIPPLRERVGAMPHLVNHFLKNAPRNIQVSSAALQVFMAYKWPGNVTELRKTIENIATICKDEIIRMDDLPQAIKENPNQRIEEILQHAQRMESLGILASGISHNFRNILSGITVNSQLIQMKYTDSPELQEISARIDSFAKRGASLVKDLMDFARKEDKGTFGIVNLVQVIEETYNLIKESFDKKIDIIIEVPESLPVVGTRAGLSQVLMNLCTNARDAMPDGGKLRIEAKQEGDKAKVIVSDTGCGMDDETQNKCFDPFYTTKPGGMGTGLGLSTIYGIIKDIGGEISVFSEPDKGTTFKIYFQLDTTGAKSEQQVDIKGIAYGNGQKVLIVDDETEILTPMEDMLEGLGYKSDSASSGEQAVAKFKKWQPNVVLLDRNMPDMDGTKCAEIMLEYDPAAKIVFLSGYDEKGADGLNDKERQIIKGYLTKPIDMMTLSQLLAELFYSG